MLIKALITGEGGGGGNTGLLAILKPLTDREPKTWQTIVLYYTLINSYEAKMRIFIIPYRGRICFFAYLINLHGRV